MSMKELVVCKFTGCNQVYTDPRFLPCGKRTCAAHIESMLVKRDDELGHDRKMIKCHFCQKIHHFPDDGDEFPRDENIHELLNIRYSFEHDAAKKSFNEAAQLLEKLMKRDDNEDYVIDYFERVEAEILIEKEANLQKLLAYYIKLVDDVHERKSMCLHNLKTNKILESELDAIKRTLAEYDGQLKRDNVDFILKTLDGDEAKWREIQSDCNKLFDMIRSLDEEFKMRIVGDQMIEFRPNSSSTQLESICGHLVVETITSTILRNHSMKNDLINLNKLSGKQFKLLYRASRDGFKASSFHAKCDNQPSTLTIIKTTGGDIFGGYTAVAWDSTSGYKNDPKAFIFSLVNARSPSPRSFPVKNGYEYSICCAAACGPSFGGGHDIFISDNSNTTTQSYSNLGHSFNTPHLAYDTTEAKSFLAGSYNFQVSEIEVFCVNEKKN